MSSTESYLTKIYGGRMRVKTTKSACAAFAERLNGALDESPEGVPGPRGRQIYVGKMFGVDQKAARKWLKGEGFPTLEKTIEIAKRLGVAVEWLLSGRGQKRVVDDQSTQLAELLNLWWQLTPVFQQELLHLAQFLLDKSKAALPAVTPSSDNLKSDTKKAH